MRYLLAGIIVLLSVIAAISALSFPAPITAFDETPIPAGSSNSAWTPVIETFDGVEMVLVPAGCFMMGSDNGAADEQPAHEVCVDAFWLDRTEVTNAQFAAFGGQAVETSHGISEDGPRETLTWIEADAFCKIRGLRLPTEAEWEYAARGPEGWIYPWGNDFIADNALIGLNPNGRTVAQPVGMRPAGASWVGALDMSGNVSEWTADWYGPYPSEPLTNPTGPESGDKRAIHGGSWGFSNPDYARASARARLKPDGATIYTGFRCARSDD